MLRWLTQLFQRSPQPSPWSVRIENAVIITGDGQGTEKNLAEGDLRKVVVATDDSGPWGDDVVFLLYADGPDPVGLFPLEADGCQEFVAWLTHLQGYRDEELSQAMASTRVARFVVYEAAR